MPTAANSNPMSEPHAPSDSPVPHPAGDGDTNILAFPASPAQEAFFYLEKLQPAHPAFNVPVRFTLNGVIDRGLLKAAFEALVARHESLRTHFAEDDGNLLQVITEGGKFSLPCADISHLSGTEL